MITDELLLNAGYKQFKTGLEFYPTAETGFKKRFDDEIGKKVFHYLYQIPGLGTFIYERNRSVQL